MNRLSLYIFYGLLAYMPLHIFLSTWLGTSFGVLEPAKVIKDVLLVIGFMFVLVPSIKAPWFKGFLRTRLIWIIVAYAGLNILLALVKPTDQDAEILGLVYNTRFLLFFLYAWLLTHHFKPQYLQKRAVQIVLGVASIVVLFGIVQYTVLPDNALTHLGFARENGVLPAFFIDDKPDLERVMSTLRDPNSLGSYLIIIGMLSLAYATTVKSKQLRAWYGVLFLSLSVCLWLTFSRSAWLGFVLALGTFIVLYSGKLQPVFLRRKRTILYMGVTVVVLLTGGLFVLRDSYFVQNVVFHADDSTVLEDPNQLRIRFWQESVENILAEPEGSGPGTAGLASIRNEKQGVELNENYYLQIGSELGILGLGLFLILLTGLGLRLYWERQNVLALALLASFVGLLLTNFLVHIWSNEAVAYTWWGLAGLLVYASNKDR